MIRRGKTSNTELSMLAECEMKWWLRYGEDWERTTDSPALLKGRAVHVGLEAYHLHGHARSTQEFCQYVAEVNGGDWRHVAPATLDAAVPVAVSA